MAPRTSSIGRRGRSTGSTSAPSGRRVVARVGMKQGGATFSNARYLGVGGPDLLILDAKNVLWRWRPADAEGNGTLTRVRVQGSTSLGRRHQGVQHVPPRRVARALQPVRHRSIRAADPGLFAGGGRERLPRRPDGLARDRAGCHRDELDVRGRRLLRRGRRGDPTVRVGQGRWLGCRTRRSIRCCDRHRRTCW